MRKYVFAAAVCAAALMVGCSSGSPNTSVVPADEETTAVVTTAAVESGEGKLDQAAFDAAVESLEARIEAAEGLEESLESVEESLAEMESSIQEAMSSMAEETAEDETEEEEETTVAYEALLESAAEYKDKELTYTGSVVQSVDVSGGKVQILIAVDDDDSMRLVGEFDDSLLSDDLGHGDTVTVKGTFDGVNRYMMGSGERVELPALEISEISVDSVAETEPETEAETPAAETVPETEPETETPAETTAAPSGPLG